MTRLLRLLAVALLLAPVPAAAQSGEYEVKAAFLHNIAKFVEWPPTAGDGPMRLCILGQNPFGGALDTLRGKSVGDRPWEIAAPAAGAGLRDCRVLFVAGSESAGLRRTLDSLRGSPVLTVGDTEGYAQEGVMVNFYLEQNRVRFEVNVDAVRRAGLKIGSQLLKLARVIQNGREGS